MVTSGLYRHKTGRNYRVLFVAPWFRRPPEGPDAPVYVSVVAGCVWLTADEMPISAVVLAGEKIGPLIVARWSGNDTNVEDETPVVIYVALYGDGRVAARPLAEFEDSVKETGGLRFERIGE